MAALTVALMDDIRVAVKRTLHVQAYNQADWQARGAEDFVLAYLKDDFQDLEIAAKSALLQANVPLVLPTADGAITLTLKDASHCFNLNSLVTEDGNPRGDVGLEFVALSELLGLPQNQAVSLSSALIDWQDPDQQISPGGAEDGTYLRETPPYRTSDTAMAGPEELRAIYGMDEDLWELFRPFICTGAPSPSEQEQSIVPININTLSAERTIILAAALAATTTQSDGLSAAQLLLRDRPATGYGSQGDIEQKLTSLSTKGFNFSRVSVDVTSVFVEAVTQVGPAERVRTYRYDGLDTGVPRLTYRGWGRETFRPEIETETESELDAR